MIAGHHSTDTLAAISIATAITNCIQTFGIGLISSVSPLLSNFRGEKKSAKKYFYPTIRFAMLLAVIVMFAVLAFIPAIDYLHFDAKLVPMIKQYMFVTAFATSASSLVAASLGIATAAKIPKITITKINSIIVKPFLICGCCVVLFIKISLSYFFTICSL